MPGEKKKAKKAASQAKAAKKDPKRALRSKVSLVAKARREKKIDRRKISHRLMHSHDWNIPPPPELNGKLEVPKISSKYATYFEFADNHEKKKKLEYSTTNQHDPPPGFTFVPIGNPTVTDMCKEISRDKDAMIFIVSDRVEEESHRISEQTHRVGYHFRESIVDEVRVRVGEAVISKALVPPGFVEPIPKKQKDINDQADKALRDLFPRIPHTDRRMIIDHAFKLGGTFQGEPTVGLQANIPLSRRVQLATLAHIRHTHTRYDKLLRETTWANARKVVEPICLSVLLKWRADEETGRDQLEEILREVVVITDSESEDGSDESSDGDESDDIGSSASDSGADSDDAITIADSPEQQSRLSPDVVGSGVRRHGAPPELLAGKSAVRHLTGNDAFYQSNVESYQHGREFDVSMSKRSSRGHERLEKKGFSRYRKALADASERRDKTTITGKHSSTPSDFTENGVVHRTSRKDGKHATNALFTDDYTMHRSARDSGNPHVLKDFLVPSIEAGEANSSMHHKGELRHENRRDHERPLGHAFVVLDGGPQHHPVVRRENAGHGTHGLISVCPKAEYPSPGVLISRSEEHRMSSAITMPQTRGVIRDQDSIHHDQRPLPVYGVSNGRVVSQHPRDIGFIEVPRRAPYVERGTYSQPNISYVPSVRGELSYQVPPTVSQAVRESEHYNDERSQQALLWERRSRSPPGAVRTQVAVSRSAAVDPQFVRTFSQTQLNDSIQHDNGIVVIREHGRTPYRSREDDQGHRHRQVSGRVMYQQPLPPDTRPVMDGSPQYGRQASRAQLADGHGQVIYSQAPPSFIELD